MMMRRFFSLLLAALPLAGFSQSAAVPGSIMQFPVTSGHIIPMSGTVEGTQIKKGYFGVYFGTNDSTAYSVSDGEVTSVVNVPDAGTIVIVHSGDNYLVYCNLENTSVQKGAVVSKRQPLGAILKKNDEYTLNFQVWDANNKKQTILSSEKTLAWLGKRQG